MTSARNSAMQRCSHRLTRLHHCWSISSTKRWGRRVVQVAPRLRSAKELLLQQQSEDPFLHPDSSNSQGRREGFVAEEIGPRADDLREDSNARRFEPESGSVRFEVSGCNDPDRARHHQPSFEPKSQFCRKSSFYCGRWTFRLVLNTTALRRYSS